MAKVTIIGVGEIGRAIGKILSSAGHQITYWDKNENLVFDMGEQCLSLPEALRQTETVFFCVPSWSLSEALAFAVPYFSKSTIAVSVSKGINENNKMFVDEILKKSLPSGVPAVMLSGAMIAEELMSGQGGVAVAASSSKKANNQVKNLFAETSINVTPINDIHGAAVAGVLKNIYALALGVASGLGWGCNEKGLLMAEAIGEMSKLIVWLGGQKKTLFETAILADFFATVSSGDSSNRQTGIDLAKYNSVLTKSESAVSLPLLIKIIGQKRVKKLPILFTLGRILLGKIESEKAFEDLKKIKF
ncbi:MAG: NAD(P)-dependent oxidoreductase [Candidatus Paceibacterota bacterium]|jgi:glycerol-3-phosphate dehydrogenase (NAD(P)+)